MEHRNGNPAPLSPEILGGVHWSFIGPTYESSDDFQKAVQEYQIDIGRLDSWKPNVVVIRRAKAQVQYMTWVGNEQVEPLIELSADNQTFFTAGELLFKVHNAIVKSMEGIDRHFFEGFYLIKSTHESIVPQYRLRLGS